ncbi:hypothetical protein ALI22I_02565 [Saccharothrix sp. ALI-22-I]|nr:hypothetical protein ALI22I_02565 [Saccharothrix sp. ALI-22-I]
MTARPQSARPQSVPVDHGRQVRRLVRLVDPLAHVVTVGPFPVDHQAVVLVHAQPVLVHNLVHRGPVRGMAATGSCCEARGATWSVTRCRSVESGMSYHSPSTARHTDTTGSPPVAARARAGCAPDRDTARGDSRIQSTLK